jgi:hypothetical protein
VIYSVQQIRYDCLAFIKELGGSFADFVIGVGENPRSALFTVHNVHPERDAWMYRQALSFAAVRTVNNYFVGKLGVDGAEVTSGPDDCDCIYLYKKSETTTP